jgi:hypothetical protein
MDRLAALEARYVPRLRRALLRQVELAAAYYEAGATPELAAARVSSAEVVAVLSDLYERCGLVEAKRTYDSLTPAVKALAPPAVVSGWASRLRRFISTEGALAVRGITDTTRRLVRRVLGEAADQGLGVADAARQLRQQVGALAPARATRIVRTELISATNFASTLGAESTGLKLEKYWIATKDGRTRPEHARANGQGAPLQGGTFQVGGYQARYPGDPMLPAAERVNCRCAVGYRKVL